MRLMYEREDMAHAYVETCAVNSHLMEPDILSTTQEICVTWECRCTEFRHVAGIELIQPTRMPHFKRALSGNRRSLFLERR